MVYSDGFDRCDVTRNVTDADKNIPIDYSSWEFKFTKFWFRRRNQTTWSTYLPRKFSNDRPIQMLQIGVWEGMDLVWCFQNILGHPESFAVAIDPWSAMPPKHPQEEMDRIFRNTRHNFKPWLGRCIIVRSTSKDALPKLDPANFDLIVVDGWHGEDAVFEDGCQALRLAKPGAWIIFDDVRILNRTRGLAFDGVKRFAEYSKGSAALVWQHKHCDCYEVLQKVVIFAKDHDLEEIIAEISACGAIISHRMDKTNAVSIRATIEHLEILKEKFPHIRVEDSEP